MSHAAEASTDHCIWLHQYWCRLDKSDLWRMMEGTGERMESVEVNVDQRFEYFGSEAEGGGAIGEMEEKSVFLLRMGESKNMV